MTLNYIICVRPVEAVVATSTTLYTPGTVHFIMTILAMKIYTCTCNRTAPRIQKQKSRIEDAQLSLQKHPLGLYPHLEDSLPINVRICINICTHEILYIPRC